MGYQVEDLYDDIETFLKANLNTKLAEIDVEKGDFTLDTIANEAYFFQTMNESAANFDPFVFYGEDSVVSTGSGPFSVETHTIDIGVLMERRNDASTGKRLIRYRRALRELFENNWVSFNKNVKLTITSLAPWPLVDADGEVYNVGIGVSISASLGS